MVNVNQAYKDAFAIPYREGERIKITIPVIDPQAADDVSLSDSDHIYYSVVDGIQYDNLPQNTYATLEPGRLICDGSQLVPPRQGSASSLSWQGYASNVQSRSDGIYSSRPQIHMSFTSARTFPALTLYFDVTTKDYPSELLIIAYRGANEVLRITANPDNYIYEVIPPRTTGRRGFSDVDAVDIIWIDSGYSHRRARLQYIVFGYILRLNNSDISNTSLNDEADPITRRLPSKTLSISLLNHDGEYDDDNPDGIWEDLEERIPIYVECGARISYGSDWEYAYDFFDYNTIHENDWHSMYEGEVYQWLNLGTFYLDSKPTSKNRTAEFKGITILDFMTGDYYRGKIGGGNLYDIAIDVLQSANIPRLADGSNAWKLWSGLASITTSAPFPVISGREALQLIAHAACCVLFVDRDGYIRIEPISDLQYDDTINLRASHSLPTVSSTDALGGVICDVYTYATYDEGREIVNDTFEFVAGEILHVDFGAAYTDVAVSTGSAEIFAHGCDIIMQTSGTVSVTITGKRVDPIVSAITDVVADARETSEFAEISNKIITSKTVAQNVAGWTKRYLMNRKTYDVNYRVFPWLDSLDKIKIDGRFAEGMSAYILNHKITFNGAFGGSIMTKRVE